MRVALYSRTSTADQDCALQLAALREYAAARKWTATEYTDAGASGKNVHRPQFQRLLADARARKIDCVCVWKLDRAFRSVIDCATTLQELASMGVRFIAITQGLDTDRANPTSQLMLHILAAVAEFERSLITERVRAGMAEAKKKGTHLGRPKLVFDRERVREMRLAGEPFSAIGRELGISTSLAVKIFEGTR